MSPTGVMSLHSADVGRGSLYDPVTNESGIKHQNLVARERKQKSETTMSKFMFKLSYSQDGLKGTLAEGFANREAYVREFSANLGATVEAVYWAHGDDDLIMIVDGPSASVIAGSLAATAGGIGKVSTVPLLTAAEMDEAASNLPDYRPPGT